MAAKKTSTPAKGKTVTKKKVQDIRPKKDPKGGGGTKPATGTYC